MRRPDFAWVLAAGLLAMAGGKSLAQPRLLEQGAAWDRASRSAFYTQDQGSRLVPLAWLRALRHPDGTAFLADSLARYGYLPNELAASGPFSDPAAGGLPIGFTTGNWDGTHYVGMTCAACHTRQITVGGAAWRVDGGPALADFQSFLADLDAAFLQLLADDAAFGRFAAEVLGQDPPAAGIATLRGAVQRWFGPFHTLMAAALPTPPWGPGRLDAVGMIFDRLTGLDIGTGPDRVIVGNIRRAEAPARYPFLWNAWRQDQTQWPGFADNGSRVLGLSRNLGEVYGVFGAFEPRPWWFWTGINYRSRNSADFDGLDRLEKLIEKIGPPRWPFYLDQALAEQGRQVFEREAPGGSCASCHGITTGAKRAFGHEPTWHTPITPLDQLGTDTRAHQVLAWRVDTGVLAGTRIPFLTTRLGREDAAFNVLKTSVVGAIVEHVDPLATGRSISDNELAGAFRPPPAAATVAEATTPEGYESRVLAGIWAAAPYLHNGSVPTLADLLTAPAARPARFHVGAAYDLRKIGLAEVQDPAAPERVTTGCEDRASGSSRCGHAFGTGLSPQDKVALLEYLKGL